ncbi:MAG: type I secretion system permease/ATPase [Candidatus Dactylopiibacterium carminicum]|uniref:Cyclolysin secretion/processing ATP-binding protein CyaB n=1 Tax=Candidatus Dactylopiibacterium carminicum TaxID=857335 RepID=A0A272EYC5_9RHOO|nr:type I secretion system permease/ATPase [Candidatus Dactylopiibacterium carminicum]KAF7600638.1 type I secretion system permease/ATPase [Candidatus Dactylopiibacterium carminicum]PAS95128.1 MAG: type I secretion system permease/ATPase [Candidatus Dactylopiibacterium carminicum]PAT00636.1 MAG: ABC transporter [Candidatus Dactylopiibacterium carminicum]
MSSNAQADNWQVHPHNTHVDPLLHCLAQITRLHGKIWTAEALGAGLARVEHLLPPSQLTRAAARAGFSARLLRKPLAEIPKQALPAILLLQNKRACLLLEHLPDGQLRIGLPESPESSELIAAEALAADYTGVFAMVQPRFIFDARTRNMRRIRSQHWFWSAIFANWRLYRDVLFAALLVNIFALAIPMFSMNVYDRVVPNQAIETLWVLSIGVLLVLGFDFLLRTIRAYIIDTASKRVDVILSARIMERVLGVRLAARPISVGAFAANLRAFEAVREFIASATVTALVDLPFVLIFLLVLVWISPWLILPSLVGILLILMAAWVTQGKMHELTETTYRASAQRNATLIESLVGLETIKTLGAEGEIQRRWEKATNFISQVASRTRLLSASTLNFAQGVQQAVNVFTIILGVYLLADKQISMGAIIAASIISGRAIAPLGQVAGLMMQFQNARTGLASVDNQMELPVERPEEADFLHRKQFHGDIEFREVGFHYPNSDQRALRKISMRIKAGEKIGIIGRVGSGKTTLEKLILGLYQATEGAVLIDGIDSRQIDPVELRRAISFVPQDPTLFFGTLRQNIAMGSPLADDAAILTAADLAGVTEFANMHPQGFDMQIGERGESLSGGQRQAVAIARAVLNDGPILLLDEPSSNMDHQSEEQLKQRLRVYAASKTLLLVTHRTSLLDLVDRLIVIDNGSIVADGPKAQVVDALQQGRIGRAG